MEIVWMRNKQIMGNQIFYGETPARAIANSSWELLPGDIIEIREEEIDTDDIFDDISHRIEQSFTFFQKKYDITNGDISPWEAIKLDEVMMGLAELMGSILKNEKRSDVDG